MANVLIIDDDPMMCDSLSQIVRGEGHNVEDALTLKVGFKKAVTGSYDVVFLDVRLPDGNGLEAIPELLETPLVPEIIIITGVDDPNGAELAIRSGAWDYIQKPFSIKEVTLPLVRALQYRGEKKGKKPLVALNREGIIGNSPKMRACFDLLAQVANSEATVLITGETGTGKELFAQAIHNNSARAGKNFVVVDCAALPKTLVESVLFGHEKGAFTGADKPQEGLVKQADGGTLFLDEVGELTLSVQKSFLRVLQERRFRPLGGKKEIKSDFRLVAATNLDLDKTVRSKKFRQDLLFRLRSFVIDLPPLGERPEDIKGLALYYMARFCERYQTGTKGFSPEFAEALAAYDWPGNVRELVHTMEKAILSARHDPTLYATHLPPHIRIQVLKNAVGKKKKTTGRGRPEEKEKPVSAHAKYRDFKNAAIAEAEKGYFQDLIAVTKGDIKKACEISGLSRSRLYSLLKKNQMSTPAGC